MKKACVVYLCRHVETAWNAERRLQGHRDTRPNARGLAQAEALGRRLASEGLEVIWSSDLERAQATARAVSAAAAGEVAVVTTPALREMALGEAEGLTVEEVAARFGDEAVRAWRAAASTPQARARRHFGGESIEELVARGRGWLEAALEGGTLERVAVVTHGGMMRHLLAAIAPTVALGHVGNAAVFRMRYLGAGAWDQVELWSGGCEAGPPAP